MNKAVYRLGCRTGSSITFRIERGFPFHEFDGSSRQASWEPPPVEILGKSKPPKDFVGFRLTAPCISSKAVEILRPLIEPYCEILEFAHFKNHTYHLLNVMNIVDCVDWDASDVHRGKDNKLYNIERCAFNLDLIPNIPIFKVLDNSEVFVQQSFVDIVLKHMLTNVIFTDPDVHQFPLQLLNLDCNIVPYVAL